MVLYGLRWAQMAPYGPIWSQMGSGNLTQIGPSSHQRGCNLSCLVLSSLVLFWLVLSCLVVSCLVLYWLVSSCLVLAAGSMWNPPGSDPNVLCPACKDPYEFPVWCEDPSGCTEQICSECFESGPLSCCSPWRCDLHWLAHKRSRQHCKYFHLRHTVAVIRGDMFHGDGHSVVQNIGYEDTEEFENSASEPEEEPEEPEGSGILIS